ncbi:Uncharacterized protein OS=Planctomyces maris DSM 8797 GN=PM8797T_10294 PE=4 SV=1 [Tuwongella immobilis]|uniref:Uncharacterized protein n=2 Tax=Tuwongella immobilis TaxID=692036 RepID=A0A6C2YJQ3_9BACT|nr:Uncharacterized protein OS=Planctomyces maris DSM 8797 GN=PM8797T_10294 PE=4 SV=1 [Tuwongella immobilis]VTR99026.1 Uncharacterized protein OS=Planctomyces maris DSM 8797 GN=PM8797T_10294 PE=4 SV=1 [Tuwongella immobilis]
MHTIMEQLLRIPAVLERSSIGKESGDITAALSLSSAFPPSYIEFLTRYGGVKLFREGFGYQMAVLPTPMKVDDDDYGDLYQFGWYHDSFCYFSPTFMKPGAESPVYEIDDGELVMVAPSFSEWFSRGATALLSQQPLMGEGELAVTFSEQEQAIVRRRTQYQWHITGRTEKFVVINMTNLSDATLDFITIGVRSIDRSLNGAVRVDVRDLAVGMSKDIPLDCYSELVHPSQVELFNLPEPSPATRSMYFEFQ